MIIVADTSPLRYLIVIEEAHVLPVLYGRVAIPPAVLSELANPGAPAVVRRWIAARPDWLEITAPATRLSDFDLDLGEAEALSLASEIGADFLLIDERRGRREAMRRHVPVVGTLRVLLDAAEEGLTDLRSALVRLRSTNFRVDPQLLDRLMDTSRRRS